MGKVTTYCQISGCSPEVKALLGLAGDADYECGPNLHAALRLLQSEDETEGQQALSVIGALNESNDTLWDDVTGNSHTVEEALALPESCVRVLHGCSMGRFFDMGSCQRPPGERDFIRVSYGCCFFVLTNMLPILEAATSGRVSPRRLWNLAMSKGHLRPHSHYGLPGVDYGPISNYINQFPWLFGTLTADAMESLEDIGAPEDIANIIRDKGFWMWMRPDRFPIDPPTHSSAFLTVARPAETTLSASITALPSELLHSIALLLPLSSVVILARLSRTIYYQLLGSLEARDTLAKAYMRTQARWCLPYGEAECRWWHERNSDDSLGWEYLRRCWSESYSMRNRERIWRAAESIEEECEREEAKRANEADIAPI